MRVVVDGQGYTTAAEAFVCGQGLAARAGETLAGRLAGYAGMAGDDASAAEFASSYDDAAAESLAVVGDLAAAFGSLAQLADASLGNHHRAEADALLPGRGARVDVPPAMAAELAEVRLTAPPSSLGGDPPSIPGALNWVLDRIEGFVWPNADTDRLRCAAAAWRDAATSVGLLGPHCEMALLGFEGERSPEIPLAVATTEDLRRTTDQLTDQLSGLAGACDEYAAHVDAKRAEMIDLLEQLATELLAGAVVTGALGVLSAGLAAPAAGAAASARLAWAARELKMIVDALRLAAGGTASGLRPVAATVRDSRGYLSRLAASRRIAMTERGAFEPGAFLPRGLLARHEAKGHTMRVHVGRSREWLHDRVVNHPTAKHASSFPDETTAERAVAETLGRRSNEIDTWLAGKTAQHRIDDVLDRVIGVSIDRAGDAIEVRGLRVVLVRDPQMPEGYWIKTAYPTPGS